MTNHLLWFRLPKGRVWHVAASGAPVALCGQVVPDRAERQPKRPPFGARPCPDCRGVNVQAADAIEAAQIKRLMNDRGLRPAEPRHLTDPDDDGDLPDMLGQDGEVSIRG